VDIFRKGNTMATMTEHKGRRTRRSFTEDYKAGAIRLVLDEGKTVAAAARDLGLTESSLRNWVEQARAGSHQRQDGADDGRARGVGATPQGGARAAYGA